MTAWESHKEEKTLEKAEVKILQTRIFILYEVPLEDDFQIWLIKQCEDHGIDYAVMVAMAEQESTFNPEAVGADGELGMWQLKPSTAAEAEEALGRRLNLFDPYDNAEAAIFLMEKYIEEYGDDIKALIVYNMGETGARRCFEKSIPRSEYAVSVMEKAQSYKQKEKIVQVTEYV